MSKTPINSGKFTFRPIDDEVIEMLEKLSSHFSRSKNNTVNYCIKEIYKHTFK